MDGEFLFLALTDRAEHVSEEEYVDWYRGVHIPDTIKSVGWTSGQMYRRSRVQPAGEKPPWEFLVAYTVTGPETTILERVDAAAPSGPLSVPDRLMWKTGYRLWTYRKSGGRPFDLDSEHALLAFADSSSRQDDQSSCADGKDGVPEALAGFGRRDAMRYELAGRVAQRPGHEPYPERMTWYAIDKDEQNILRPFAEEGSDRSAMRCSWSPGCASWAYTRIGERIFA
ncbi:MAG: hypothetical protein LBK28_04265 [Propionibacteriaceae bacterium]|jgi:hypothetical protein|nr:hypothetical protein [Propionibacteriaceae bacterium]